MGWHLPLIPPFRASDDEAAFFVGAIGLGRKCFTANATPILVLSKSISMFENADEDALILVIEMGQDFGEAIEDLRGMMDHRTDMKYPYNFMLNFVTVAHGQRLAQKIEKAGGIHAVFGGINPCTTTGLEYPTIQQKTSRGWVPVKG